LGKGFCALEKKSKFYLRWFSKKKEIDATILLANDSVYVASMTMFFFLFGTICFSQIHQPRTMHIKFAQRHCNVHAQTWKPYVHPGGIGTRDLLFWRRTRWPL
jgi:hypothetical protein